MKPDKVFWRGFTFLMTVFVAGSIGAYFTGGIWTALYTFGIFIGAMLVGGAAGLWIMKGLDE